MKISFKNSLVAALVIALAASGCKKTDLLSNPNVAAESSTVPASLILNHITGNMLREEEPVISPIYRYNQFIVSNYSYYFGTNSYNWSNSNSAYDFIRYCNKLEEQAAAQYDNTSNVYFGLSKFYKAYAYIWLTQRVGDIPMSESGVPGNLTPKYDSQHDVYKNSLALLDSANMIFEALASPSNAGKLVDATGDIFGLTYLQWQKLINTYKLRVLISLSKRADDNPDLNIKQQFAEIIGDPAGHPIMESNKDNMAYRYTSVTLYPPNRAGYAPYNNCENISQTFFNVTAAWSDPRVYTLTIPAPAELADGKTVSDFTAYVGEDNGKSQGLMSNFSADGKYSNLNWQRYMSSASGANAEPYIVIGYPEMCFNIAEAAYRGWITEDAAEWYLKGINASMSWYGLSQGQQLVIGNVDGSKPNLGTATVDINAFLANPNVAYSASRGLEQIITQKYVAFFMNSGFEAYYNWRRTGFPEMSQGGVGIGTPDNEIPIRWQYPQDEITYNNSNYTSAVTAQYGGSDDIFGVMWLLK